MIEASLETGSSIEFVLTLPQQITLAGDVNIRCYARVLRVEPTTAAAAWPRASSVTNSFPPPPEFRHPASSLPRFSPVPVYITSLAKTPSLIFVRYRKI